MTSDVYSPLAEPQKAWHAPCYAPSCTKTITLFRGLFVRANYRSRKSYTSKDHCAMSVIYHLPIPHDTPCKADSACSSLKIVLFSKTLFAPPLTHWPATMNTRQCHAFSQYFFFLQVGAGCFESNSSLPKQPTCSSSLISFR